MADMRDIEPNYWRAEREITPDNKVRTIISSLLQLQSCLSTYVSNEDMEKMIYAKEAFDSRQMDTDELLVVVQNARRKAEERQTIRNRSLEDLQQTLSRILAKTESWPLPLRSGISKRCESEQRWLDSVCDRAASDQTAEKIMTRIKKEVEEIEGHIKNLKNYFNFAEENARLTEEPTYIPHFHVHWKASKSDWIFEMTPINIFDTQDWVFGELRTSTPKCEKFGCSSRGKPHAHVIDDHEYDVRGWRYLLLCVKSNCNPRLLDLCCDQDCDCIKHNKRPYYMPKEAEVFEQPVLA